MKIGLRSLACEHHGEIYNRMYGCEQCAKNNKRLNDYE